MKTIVRLAFAALPFTAVFAQGGVSHKEVLQKFDNKVLYQENKGQVVDTDGEKRSDILFTSYSNGVRTYFKKDGVSYVFEKYSEVEIPKYSEKGEELNTSTILEQLDNRTVEMHRIDLNLIGANLEAQIIKEQPNHVHTNYYLGHIQVDHVQSFEKVTYVDIYPNIDMVLYTKDGGMKYDFVVRPGGNPADIQMAIEGTENYSLDAEGQLILESHLGKITEGKPYVLQGDIEVASYYVLRDGVLTFNIADYNKEETLIIDPTRDWGTYYTANGGQTWQNGQAVAANADGAYWVFNTTANAFPVTPGAFDGGLPGGDELQVAHFNTVGALVWSTYLGGSGLERWSSIAANNTELAIACVTNSVNYPMLNPFQGANAGSNDFALTKLNTADGTGVWSTYIGGVSNEDRATGVDINAAGEVVLFGGEVSSTNYPTTPGAYDVTYGDRELVLSKFNSAGGLMWSTFLGSTCGNTKFANRQGVRFDNANNVIVLGRTSGNCLPTTGGTFDPTYNGDVDLWLASVAPDGSGLNAASYIGSGALDGGSGFVADVNFAALAICSDNSIVVGSMSWVAGAVTWAATPGSYQSTNNGFYGGYVIKFDNTLNRTWGSTWAFPGVVSWLNDIAVDEADNVFLLTGVNTSGHPNTPDFHQTYTGNWDKHIAQLSADGTTLLYATHLGTGGYDMPETGSLAYSNGSLYTAFTSGVNSSNPAEIVSAGAHQVNATGSSMFPVLNKFQFAPPCIPTTITPDAIVLSDATGQCSVTPMAPTATNDCGTTVNGTPDVTLPITTNGTTVVTWTYDDGTNTTTQTQNVVLSGPAQQTVVPLDQEICPNTSANIQVNSSEVGFDYVLREEPSNAIVDGPLAGTGGPLVFNTGNIATTTNYNVLASDPTTSGALNFDGSNDFVSSADPAFGLNTMTIEAWVNPTAFTNSFNVIAGKWDDIGISDRGYFVALTGTGQLTFYLADTPTAFTQVTSPAALPTGVWSHVAATYEGSALRIFVDGVEVSSVPYAVTTNVSAAPFMIGSSEVGAATQQYFNGTIDDVRVWDVALPTATIASNMDACLSGGETNLVANYNFEDGTGSVTATDIANGYTGTLTNMDPATDWVQGVGLCGSCQTEMSAIATVTVDNTAPVAVCQNITVVLDATGNATITAADIDGGSTDFCPVTLSIPSGLGSDQFDCTTIGVNTVTLTVTDDNGNTATCDAIVTVEDNEAPTVTCNNFTVALDGVGNATITTDDIGGLTAADNCGIASVTASTTSFTCADLGDNTVTITVTDNNGNVTTCDAIVTVEDVIAPTVSCNSGTQNISDDGTGDCTFTPFAAGQAGTYDIADNCSDPLTVVEVFTGALNTTATFSLAPGAGYTPIQTFPVGVTNVNVTVTDASGNSASCSYTTTIVDDEAPTALCQNITVFLDGAGNASIVPSDIDAGSFDNCSGVTLAASAAAFTCADVGPNTVTLTVTDASGNVSTCPATVTVEDNVASTAICQNITVQVGATGTATITTGDIDNGSNDACGIASLALDVTTFDCSDVGANPVTLTVTDNNGNTSTCAATVTVEDNELPVVICQDITVQLDATGNVTITPAQIDNGSSDVCGIASLGLDVSSFDCSNVGVNPVVLTVVDVNGNTATCSANVTVVDDLLPVVTCPSDITLNSILDNCGRIVDYVLPATDNCSFTITQTDGTGFTSGDLFPVGTTVQSYEIEDANGNITLCSFNVTIVDNQLPSITGCPANITASTELGVCEAAVSWIQPTASDNCPGVVFTTSHAPGSIFPLGTTTVTYTATDASGNISTCTFDVTVVDNEAPIFVDCPADISVSNDPGACEAAVLLGSPTVTDNCSLTSVTPSFAGPFPVGTTVVTWTALDASGNTSTCTQNINVIDDEAPIALCQNITVQLDASGNTTILASAIDGGSLDNCGIASLGASKTAFDCSNIGANTVTLTVTDVNGNTSTCDAVVTVEDNLAPVAICQDITVQLDGSGNASITGADIDNASNDACGIASVTVAPNAFTCANIGANAVVLTVTDNNGNITTCNATVTVADTVAPTAICQDIIVQLDAAGNGSLVAADIDGGSTDACGIFSLSADVTNFNCSDAGPNTVTLTVTDNNGNSSTCTSTVTVQDTVSPTAICQDIIVQLDSTGNASITAAQIDNGSSDICGIATTTIDVTTFDCSNVGPNTVTLTVTDVNGNVSTCTSTVTVEDNIAPIVNCSDITIDLDAFGNATIIADDILNASPGGYILDQTGTFAPVAATGTPVGLGDDQVSGALPIGFNFDFYGNSYSQFYLSSNGFLSFDPGVSQGCCQGGVIPNNDFVNNVIAFDWDDLYPPGGGSLLYQTTGVAPNRQLVVSIVNMPLFPNSSPDVTSQVILYESSNIIEIHTTQVTSDGSNQTMGIENSTGTEGVVVPGRNSTNWTASNDYVAFIPTPVSGATDACGIATTSLDISTFDCSNVGPNTVTVTATDVNGNSTTCTSTVTVEDNVAPTAICQDVTVQLDATGNASVASAQINNGSSDACGLASIVLNDSTFNCSDVGPNTVILTVTDVNGNVSTCSATVTVQDTIAPTAICQDLTVQLDATGSASITAAQIDNGSSDICGVASTTIDVTTFDCSNVGPNTVTLTVTDVNGNISTCTSTVTVVDTIAPTVVCNDITVQLNASGNATITTTNIDGGASFDNCGIASQTLDISTFDCSDVGANTVTMTVTDVNGNISTCSSTVTVEDNVAPTAICDNITIQLDATGNASIVGADIDGGSNDACGVASVVASPSTFTCANVGTNAVTLTVTDNNGNVSTCVATVTVQDTIPPVAICQDITVQLDAGGNATITGASIDNGSNAACGIASLVATPNVFDCSDVGLNTVTLTVTDNNGNIATCTSTVTVLDTIAPTAVCQDIVVQLDASGAATITAAQLDGGSADACGIASTTIDISSFDCSNVGANTVTLTVTDVNGNVSTCTSTVTVEDNVDPVISCPADLTVSADPGVCDASSVAFGTATATDACGILSIVNDAPAVFPLGNTTVTWTATDVNGNTTTCAQIVTVIDSENPVIACPADVVVNNNPNECFATGVVLGTATATDNCSPPLLVTITNDAPSVFPVGITNVTWTATDDEGNSSICTQIVTVVDNEAPLVTCPANITVSTDGSGCFATGVALGTPTATDNCSGIASITNNAPLAFPLGTTTVTWTVTDDAGNTTTCTQDVTVEDNEDPVIICPANITVATDPGACDATIATLGTELAFDNCTIASVSNDAGSLTFPIGTTTVTWTVIDGAGNSSTCTQTVTVLDTEAPTIVCAADTTVSADAGSCDASGVVLSAPAVSDNCVGLTTTNDAPTVFPLGNTTVTWTVVDAAGNAASCTQIVTVEDNELPTITCPADVTIATAGGSCDVSFVALGTPTTADNCGVASVSNDAPVTFGLGTTIVTWTVTDNSGNSATCTQSVTVEDNEVPIISCPADIVITADPGVCESASVVLGVATATDNCTIVNVASDAPAVFPLGTTTVTWTATDAAGNTATCTQLVTVTDDELPTITCPADITITADAGVCESSSVVLGTPATTDNCSVASVTNDAPIVFPLGTTTVTWTVVDGSGNTATCAQTVTVTDDELPMIACAGDTTIATIPGLCEGTVALTAPVTSDNCAVVSVTNDAPAFFALGTTPVTWTVTDGSGNIATCVQLVTVEDTEAPTIFCPADITASTDPGLCEAVVALGSPIVNDNCNIASVTNDAPAAFPIGTTVVTWTIEDDFGNTATCTQSVTVEDNEAPLIVCPADVTVTNVPGNCGRNVSYTVPSFMDNCNVTAMTQTDGTGLTSGSWFPIGTTLQEYTVVDQAGNTFSCSFNITVVDNEAPLITDCPSDITVFASENTCEIPVNFGTPVVSDNCPGATYTASHFSGQSFPIGTTTVTYTAIDNSGNTANCSFNVTVLDTISPVAPVLASVQGGCSVTLPVPTTTDNCSGTITATTTTVFPVTTVGITAVTWTFTDASGNTTNVDQFIDIDGTVDATVSLMDDVTLISNNTTPGATYQWIDCNTGLPLPGATDVSYVAPINGSYAVEVTEPGCPPATSICYDIDQVGLEDISIEELIVYPNPTAGVFNVKFDGQILDITLYDMVGRAVSVPTNVATGVVNGADLATGKYMVRVTTDSGIITKEIIVLQ